MREEMWWCRECDAANDPEFDFCSECDTWRVDEPEAPVLTREHMEALVNTVQAHNPSHTPSSTLGEAMAVLRSLLQSQGGSE